MMAVVEGVVQLLESQMSHDPYCYAQHPSVATELLLTTDDLLTGLLSAVPNQLVNHSSSEGLYSTARAPD